MNEDVDPDKTMRALSRRSFTWAGANLVLGAVAWKWVINQPKDDGILHPLRKTLEFNEDLSRKLNRSGHLVPEFERGAAGPPPVNGSLGLTGGEWNLIVQGDRDVQVTMNEILALPKVEQVTEFKCVEGWSQVVRWAGARLRDFIEKYPPQQRPGYLSLQTPDGGYYVGIDWESVVHPQTLLCYEMNGRPLTPEHGAPLRLVVPLKYGFKSLKRVGLIRYCHDRPPDYWAERGYDYYAGH
jgi:DMSO/TMAO reductase YedYZ molybdopterin-dependent catalytic subunit